ncbi:hypothetical protein HK099_004675, partial [Clydaea vesicula]
ETFCSTKSGKLIFTHRRLIWIEAHNNQVPSVKKLNEVSFSLSILELTKYIVGNMVEEYSETKTKKYQPKLNYSRKSKTKETKMTSSLNDNYYLIVHHNSEVFKFYPFNFEEIKKIKEIFKYLTNTEPFTEENFIKEVLSQQLQSHRKKILTKLVAEKDPWIFNSYKLNEILDNLTQEHGKQNLFDLERLFHSCRLESEVLKESLPILKRIWSDTRSEEVRLKVLQVVDRLVDRVLMRQGDPVFETTFQWLRLLEETLDPYKSKQALPLIISIVNRAKIIQIEPLTPLNQPVLRSMFDDFDDFCLIKENLFNVN